MKLRTRQPSPFGRKTSSFRNFNKELSSFSFISSHDLQEPLRKIQTFSSRILEKEIQNLSDNGVECLKRVQNAAQRMQLLIDDLVTYTKINASGTTYKTIRFQEVINDIRQDLKKNISEKKATIDYQGETEIRAVPYQLYLLLHNLISNSLKFSHPERSLQIQISSKVIKGKELEFKGTSSRKKYLHINISDNGIGFEPKFCERIFEVFQRLHDKDEYEGTGIGLAICKKIVENHRGFITAKGSVNNGATFDIYLPEKNS